jgi:hypothetical protein
LASYSSKAVVHGESAARIELAPLKQAALV